MHWAIFLLVVTAYVAINLRGPKGSDMRVFWTDIHMWAGMSVFGVALLRTGWRLSHTVPEPEPGPPWMIGLARATHIALYVFILVQPVLGVVALNLGGHPVPLLGLGWSVSVVGANKALEPFVEDAHALLGNTFYFVIGLHALAALWHHYVLHDNTLRKML
jgi:cytochrome b561